MGESLIITDEQLVKHIKKSVDEIKLNILTAELGKKQYGEILDMLRFYIGNETLSVDLILTVNLHKVHSENVSNTSVKIYCEQLRNSIKAFDIEITAGEKALTKLDIQLEEMKSKLDEKSKVRIESSDKDSGKSTRKTKKD